MFFGEEVVEGEGWVLVEVVWVFIYLWNIYIFTNVFFNEKERKN